MTDSAAPATTEEATTTEPTALQQAAQEAAPQQTTQPTTTSLPVAERIPEKFRTMKEDGTLDLEASAAKMSDSYSYLEKKLGSGEAPPKTPDEYQVQLSEEVGITFDDLKEDPQLKDFMAGAHSVGLTNAQVSYVLDQYMKALPGDLEAAATLRTEDCISALKETTWKTDIELKAGLADAYRAVSMVAGDDADYLMTKHGNDPAFVRFVAKFGEGLREDSPPQGAQIISADEFTDVVAGIRAELDAMSVNDPRRPALLKRQQELYDRQYGNAPAHGLG